MAVEVGTAYVSLLPSARGFAAATSRELGRSSSGLRQAGGKAGQAYSAGFLPGIKSVHTAIIGLGGLAVAKFAKDSVKAFSESEDAENKLNFAYQKFPRLADVSRQSLSDLADAMQRKTVFDDESLKSGEAVLSQFNLTGKQVEQILPLVADYAAKTGRDIPEASTLVGKALLGNARALKEMGINFKATGDTGRDYAAIQQLISDKVGGFAENQGKTAAGQAQILKNQYNELQETVGSLLVPALSDLVGIVTPLLVAFGGLPKPLQDVILGVGLLSVAAVVIVPRLGATKAALVEMGLGGEGAAVGLTATATAEDEVGASAVTGVSKVDKFITTVGRMAGLTLLVVGLSNALGDTADNASAAAAGVSAFGSGNTTARLQAITQQFQSFPDLLHRSYGQLFQTVTHSTDVLDKLGVSAADINGHLADGDDAWNAYKQSLVDAAGKAGFNSSTQALLADNLDRVRDSSHKAADGQKVLGAAQQQTLTVTQQMQLAYAHVSDIYNAYTGRLEASFRIHAQVRQAYADATQAIKDLGKAHNVTRIDIDKAMGSILDAADAAAAAVTGVANKNKAYRDELVKLRNQTAPGSALRKTLDGYITRLGNIPKTISTKVLLDIASAVANSRRLQEYESGFVSGGIAAASAGKGNGTTGSDNVKRRATGGSVVAGHPYLIGERGPELWWPSASGWVVPNGGGSNPPRGGDTWQVFGPSAADVAREAENLRRRRDLLAHA